MPVWIHWSCRVAVLLACLLPLAAPAHDHAMEMHGTPNAAALGADAAFDAHGRLWVVTVRDDHVLLRHSDDLGKTFSAPVPVNATAEAISATGENRPVIALGAEGQIYVAWDHPLPQRWTSEVRFARSVDGGQTFSDPVTVSHWPTGVGRAFASMAVAGNGDVVVAWIDNGDPDAMQAADKAGHHATIAYSWSSDGGATFVPDRELTRHSCECCRIALARATDGGVATLFRAVFGKDTRDHAFGVLPTDGKPAHWQRATFSGWQIPACPEQGPGLAIAADGVRHAVWYEASHGPAIWYGQLDPGHPPRHRLRIGGVGAGHADVAAQGTTVWIAWNRVDATGYSLMLRVSRDGGRHFDAARAIATSADSVYSPQLLVHDGKAFVAWNTAGGFRLIPTGGP